MSAQLKHDLSLRPMQLDDLDAIMQIEPTIYSHPWTRGNFSDSLNSGYSAWVLEKQVRQDNKEMIGYALLMLVMDEAHLLNLSIAKAYQKQGLGRYLLEHMLTIAKTHKAANMFLEVRPSNISAIALYENMGFSEMAVRRGYYPAKQGREDAVLMGLAL
ncbi:MAG TPA: ribosomal protein S18-alanine N-acetyltransferase [Methylotenera sp.]|nr:ribosomal protein S18-alanine N-acetyltransferase [Methylotenera sp.]